MRSSDYRALARQALAGNWGLSIAVALIAGFLGGLVCDSFSINIDSDDLENINFLSAELKQLLYAVFTGGTVINLVHIILGGVIRLGHCTFLLKQYDRKEPIFNDLFSRFDSFGSGLCLSLLTSIYTALWSLLFVIPGIVASYRYAMAPFILSENPHLTASQAISASKTLMDGHKMELWLLDLSFIGWSLLCVLTCGIGSIFLNPYMSAAHAAFYRSLLPVDNIIDAEA